MWQNRFPMSEVDDYLAGINGLQRAELERVRSMVRRVAPDAVECISYGVPTFKLHGMLISYAAFKEHCSIFPGKAPIEALAAELKDFKTSAGTVRFTLERPIRDDLLERIVRECVRRNESKAGFRRSGRITAIRRRRAEQVTECTNFRSR
jgi:uncharacterized protein YdhG (YjbR/CyaY superfamily)